KGNSYNAIESPVVVFPNTILLISKISLCALLLSLRCWSYLGRRGGQQVISLQQRGCVHHGTVQHEVLHALGFHHEQNRGDRDSNVTIVTENISKGKEHNFRKVETNNLMTPYDYTSVMHYGRYAFSKDYGKLPTIIPKPDCNVQIGGARQMSRLDTVRVNRLYYCRGHLKK
uniref:Metalloendopeptidase n=1 Tax=Hucho hucho TaxID=62062 RepID=A0A4W5P4C7_9TELE